MAVDKQACLYVNKQKMKKRKQTAKPDQARPGQVWCADCYLWFGRLIRPLHKRSSVREVKARTTKIGDKTKFAATSRPSCHEFLLALLRVRICVPKTQSSGSRPTTGSRILASPVKPG
ncbi:hypothetical protein T10_11128 [Trichinella papuae]|uniref:Uncharacterized protein n=1 Tax=Trichinella papuae TaxID=268474 RepID=A0A0V1MVZ1_9BILA|nr:hypothetical protein T10_11128 [Trichinella papuae]